MIYVVSDLHGSYKKFLKLLDEIRFTDKDVMYVLGDIVDYGEDSIALLCDLSMRINVLPIVGDHDYRAVRLLKALNNMLNDGVRPDQETIGEMAAWMEDGGAKVMEDFKALDADMREGVIEYLEDMSLYEELEVGKEKYMLVHAGIADYNPKLSFEDYMPEDFISEPIDVSRELIDGVTIIAGHVPTYTIEGADNGKIYYGEGSIIIDCGAAFGEPLACLCLDNGKEYYIND